MTVQASEYTYVFDDVQFGIDIRQERLKRHLTQVEIANVLGYDFGSFISMVECASKRSTLRVADFMRLCQMFDLMPQTYFDIQLASTIEIFRHFD